MKKPRPAVLGASILCCLLLPTFPLPGDSSIMISEPAASIQLIPTEDFLEWPGVEGRLPVDVSAEDDRIWLIWPNAVVSLNREGRGDARSLLALFATTARSRDAEPWSAEGGLVSSDGIWRSVDPSSGTLLERDLFSGMLRRRPLEDTVPRNLHAAPGGDLVAAGPEGARHIVSGVPGPQAPRIRSLDTDLPLMTHMAVAREAPLAAWMVPGGKEIRIVNLPLLPPGREQSPGATTPPVISVDRPFWMMDWAGELLVLAGPGRLTAFDVSDPDGEKTFLLEDDRLPRRWYRIRGGRDLLLIHSPETGLVAVVRPESLRLDGAGPVDFPDLLKSHALEAGELLEDAGAAERAEAYYTWVLAHVRRQRSRRPLDETWPALERDLSDRRARLSGGW